MDQSKRFSKWRIFYQHPMLRSDLCDYSDRNVLVKGAINVEGAHTNNQTGKKLFF